MTIDKTYENGKIFLAVRGRLDTITAPRLQDILIPSIDEAKQIELDFTELSYMSSAGLRVLLMGQNTASEKGVLMTLSNVTEEIMEILEMTGFTDILNLKDR